MAKDKHLGKKDEPKKRVVKLADAKEQTDKSDQSEKSHGVLSLTLHYLAWPLVWLGRQLAKLERFKVFRLIGRILWPSYFRQSWGELRQVTWPNRRESLQLTLAVIIFSIVFGVLIAGVDFVLDKVFKEVLLK